MNVRANPATEAGRVDSVSPVSPASAEICPHNRSCSRIPRPRVSPLLVTREEISTWARIRGNGRPAGDPGCGEIWPDHRQRHRLIQYIYSFRNCIKTFVFIFPRVERIVCRASLLKACLQALFEDAIHFKGRRSRFFSDHLRTDRLMMCFCTCS